MKSRRHFCRGRIDKALELWSAQGCSAILVPSGGQGSDEVISEAEAMSRYMLRLGVPREAILTEDQSTTTMENLRFCQESSGCASSDTLPLCFRHLGLSRLSHGTLCFACRSQRRRGWFENCRILFPDGLYSRVYRDNERTLDALCDPDDHLGNQCPCAVFWSATAGFPVQSVGHALSGLQQNFHEPLLRYFQG